MQLIDLILKKKAGKALTKEEIDFFIESYSAEKAPDYQVSALLMAICFQGMTPEETANLTLAMAKSGDRIDLSEIPGVKVDKHSTGGVGDKTSLIIAPAAAALGIPIAKMSGRGLGHTGGTIDKLESIPGLSTSLAEEAFLEQVKTIGLAIAGQTASLAPADKKLYALRDVTGTVQQLSLIASSIMSKKIAAGADKIVLDVKCGSGAFMKTKEDALALARSMVGIGKDAGLDCHALVTNMDQVLGLAVGNRVEVWEAVEVLSGRGPEDLLQLSIALVKEMALLGGKASSEEEAEKMAKEAIQGGRGLDKLIEMVEAQGGDGSYIREPEKLLVEVPEEEFLAPKTGFLTSMDCEMVGMAASALGAGRVRLDDVIDPDAGLIFDKKLGDRVEKGERICIMRSGEPSRFGAAREKLFTALHISDEDAKVQPIVLARVDA